MRQLNYRRGFQRVFAVGSFLWIVAVAALSIRDRPKRVDYDALAKNAGATEVLLNPSEVTPVPKSQFEGAPVATPPRGYRLDQPDPRFIPDPPLHIVKSEPLPVKSESPYWTYRSAVALLPPALSYFLLFWLLPWIRRGFIVNGPETSN